MRKTILILAFILFTKYCIGQVFSFNQGGTEQKSYFAEIPYKSLKGLIIIEVSINNENYNFILDTGTPTIVSESLAQKLDLKTIKKLPITDSGNKEDSLSITLLNEIMIDSILFKNIPTLIIPDSNLFLECFNADGFIGSNLLRNSIIQFSHPRKTLTITNSTKKLNLERKNSQKLKITQNQSSPFFWLELKGKDKGRVQLLFDSGMDDLFDISLNNFSIFKKYKIFENVKSSEGTGDVGIFGVADDTLHFQMAVPRIGFGKMELKNVIATTTKDANSRIGSRILEYAIVTLDYKNERIYFTPISKNILDVYEKIFPVQPVFKDGKFQIGFIWFPKKVPGIHKGDEILFLNDINCKDKNVCELLFLMKDIDSKELKIITSDNDGKIHTTIMTKE